MSTGGKLSEVDKILAIPEEAWQDRTKTAFIARGQVPPLELWKLYEEIPGKVYAVFVPGPFTCKDALGETRYCDRYVVLNSFGHPRAIAPAEFEVSYRPSVTWIKCPLPSPGDKESL